jgi:threonine dehydratase
MKTPQTPSPKLASTLGIASEVWIKREDKHQFGSHKGRSIPFMITNYHKNGATTFVISSSGNAALAAVLAISAHNKNKPNDPLTLQVFIGPHIAPAKEQRILSAQAGDARITITKQDNPKQSALQFAKTNGAQLLRQSNDDTALVGYAELARELNKIENLSAVFIPTSSGTTAEGLAREFAELGSNPEIHIVQTTTCHPLADTVPGNKKANDEISLADAIVDTIAYRQTSLKKILEDTRGAGWIADNTDIISSQELLKKTTDIDASPNSALALAGLKLAIEAGRTWTGPIILLITGQ